MDFKKLITINGDTVARLIDLTWSAISGKPSTFTPSAHASTHQHGGGDEVATATAGANAIPKAGAGGTLATGWIPDLAASKIASGQLAPARGGTGVDNGTNALTIPSTGTAALLEAANAFTAEQTITVTDAATNTTTDVLTLDHISSGTPAASFGAGLGFALESASNVARDASQISAIWTTATDASRTSALLFSTVNNAAARAEVARLTGPGALWIGKTSGGLTGAGDLDVNGNTNLGGTLAVAGAVTLTTVLGAASGGTGANLSATGGAGQYLKQSSTGAAITVGAPPYTDLTYSGLTAGQVLRATGATAAAFGAVDLADTDAVTGVLAVANGGHGVAALPGFSVYKGSSQTGIVTNTLTKVTWSNEVYDTHNDFASDKFTPTIAGKYLFVCTLLWDATVADQKELLTALYKNGSLYLSNRIVTSGASMYQGCVLVATADANGSTDYFEIYARHTDASNRTVFGDGSGTNTWWVGQWVGP